MFRDVTKLPGSFVTGLAGWFAGWAAGFTPAALLGALALSGEAPEAASLALVALFSAATLGVLGSLVGLIMGSGKEGDVRAAFETACLPTGILAFFGLLAAFALGDAHFAAGTLAFFLPGPLSAGSTAWILTRMPHGTS